MELNLGLVTPHTSIHVSLYPLKLLWVEKSTWSDLFCLRTVQGTVGTSFKPPIRAIAGIRRLGKNKILNTSTSIGSFLYEAMHKDMKVVFFRYCLSKNFCLATA